MTSPERHQKGARPKAKRNASHPLPSKKDEADKIQRSASTSAPFKEEEAGVGYIAPRARKRKIEKLKWNGHSLLVFPEVYFPHEDSFLLAEAAEKHASGKVLDLGCGTGIAGIFASKNPEVTEIVFADISKKALENAKLNFEQNRKDETMLPTKLNPQNNQLQMNKIKISFIQTDLFPNLKKLKFGTILFNPPYLPTSKEEKLKGGINRAFDGGKDGRKVIDNFLLQFSSHLTANGSLLYLNSSLTNTEKTLSFLSKHGFSIQTLSSQRFFFEELSVLMVKRKA